MEESSPPTLPVVVVIGVGVLVSRLDTASTPLVRCLSESAGYPLMMTTFIPADHSVKGDRFEAHPWSDIVPGNGFVAQLCSCRFGCPLCCRLSLVLSVVPCVVGCPLVAVLSLRCCWLCPFVCCCPFCCVRNILSGLWLTAHSWLSQRSTLSSRYSFESMFLTSSLDDFVPLLVPGLYAVRGTGVVTRSLSFA